MKKIIIWIFALLVVLGMFWISQHAMAYTFGSGGSSITINPNTSFGEGEAGFQSSFTRIFQTVMTIMEIVFVALFLIGGVYYLTALGNDEQVGKAKKVMIDAVIGIVIILLSWALGTYILNLLKGKSTPSTPTTTTTGLPSISPSTVVTPPPNPSPSVVSPTPTSSPSTEPNAPGGD